MNVKKLIILIVIIIYLSALNNKIGIYGDDAIYIILAKAIINGLGYRDIYLPDHPEHTLYPFIFPILLSPLLLFNSYLILKFVPLILGLVNGFFTYIIFRKYSRYPFLLALVVLLNPIYFIFSHSIMSEIPYLFFSLMFLIYFEKFYQTKFKKHFLITITFLYLSYFTRTIGITLLLSTILFILIKDKIDFKKLTFVLLGFIPFILWCLRNMSSPNNYISSFFIFSDPYNFDAGKLNLVTFISRIFRNLLYYLGKVVVKDLARVGITFKNPFLYIISISFWLLVLWGLIISLKKDYKVIELYTLLYLAILLIWPWVSIRFIVPIIPFLTLYFFIGLEKCIKSGTIKLLLITLVILGLAFCILESYWLHKKFYSKDWYEYINVSLYIKKLPKGIVTARACSFTYLLTEYKCLLYPYTSNYTYFNSFIENYNITYIIVDSFKWTNTTHNYLHPFLEKRNDFKIIYRKGNTFLYKKLA